MYIFRYRYICGSPMGPEVSDASLVFFLIQQFLAEWLCTRQQIRGLGGESNGQDASVSSYKKQRLHMG